MGASFANVDFGLPGTPRNPDDARSAVSMEVGDIDLAQQTYEYVGFNGAFTHNLGFGIRPITWNLVVRAKDLATLHAIAREMEQAKIAGGGELETTKGRVFQRAILKEVTEVGGGGDLIVADGPTPAGWVRQAYRLLFHVLSGD